MNTSSARAKRGARVAEGPAAPQARTFFLAACVLGIVALGGAGLEAAVPLIARYDFASPAGGGAVVTDRGPFALHGSLPAEARFVADPERGCAVHLPGGRTRVVLGRGEPFDRLTHDFTVAVWVRPDRAPGGAAAPILTKRPGWWAARPFGLGLRGDGVLEAVVHDGQDRWLHGPPLAPGVWHHVALAVSESEAVLYHDGTAVSRVIHRGRLHANAEPLALGWEEGGAFPGGDLRGYAGEIADLVLLAVPLDAARVAALRDGRLPLRPATAADLPRRGLALAMIPDALREPPAADAPLEIGIDFAHDPPRAAGMWFDATGFGPGTAEVEGRRDACWVARQGSAPNPWERSVRLVVTDPRFRDGRMPAVDVEIEYLLPAWAGIQVVADTAGGSREVAGGWQATTWRTLRFSLDDAWFGSRDFGNPESARLSDGFDLRLNASTSDLFIRAIRIRGHDRERDPDFRRLLKLADVTTPGDIFLFRPGEPAELRYTFTNIALRPVEIACRFAWARHDGTPLGVREERVRIDAARGLTLPLRLDTGGWLFGVAVVNAGWEQVLPEGKRRPLLERETYLGLVAPDRPGKAAPGEFLYGLDTGTSPAHRNPRVLRWCDELGVDIVRGAVDTSGLRLEEFERALPTYRRHGLHPLVMLEPPWDADGACRAAETGRRAAFLEEAARRFPSVTYWELGNEPDLPFFYQGPIEDYVAGYEIMARAILRGNPRAVVMPGGLCFVGEEGDRRARRLIETVDIGTVGAWAYHGHGPGAGAERAAFDRMRAAARAHGKDCRPYIDTESGMAARTRPQEVLQARTCLQKLVFAQAEGMPAFFWFRLVMSGEDYNTLRGDREPRPAALVYRNVVRSLRGHRHVRRIAVPAAGGEVHLFRDAAGSSARLVCWQEGGGGEELLFQVNPAEQAAAGFAAWDLHGNPAVLRRPTEDTFAFRLGEDPLFAGWSGGGEVRLLPAALSAPGRLWLAPGRETRLPLTLCNPLARPLSARLEATADDDLPLRLRAPERIFDLQPGATCGTAIVCAAGRPATALQWPRGWRLFADVEADPATIDTLPERLPGPSGEEWGVAVVPGPDGGIDIAAAVGRPHRERRSAWAFAEVVADAERTVEAGASADWWMAWHLNGRPVFDTLAQGNGGPQGPDTHVFPLRLRAGRNLLAVRVLSGSQGWRLHVGPPDLVRRLKAGRPAEPAVVLTLREAAGGEVLGRLAVPAGWIPEVARHEVPPPLDFRAWRLDAPVAELGALHVRNLHEAHPDASRWHGGGGDLSAIVWLHESGARMTLDVAVRDDVFDPAFGGDALDVALRTGDGSPPAAWRVAGSPAAGEAGNEARVTALVPGGPPLSAAVRRAGDRTLYRVSWQPEIVGAAPFGLHLVVRDRDKKEFKQTLEWGDPGDAASWPLFRRRD